MVFRSLLFTRLFKSVVLAKKSLNKIRVVVLRGPGLDTSGEKLHFDPIHPPKHGAVGDSGKEQLPLNRLVMNRKLHNLTRKCFHYLYYKLEMYFFNIFLLFCQNKINVITHFLVNTWIFGTVVFKTKITLNHICRYFNSYFKIKIKNMFLTQFLTFFSKI